MINDKTERLLKAFIDNPRSSVMIEGGFEMGADEVISMLSQKLLGNTHKSNVITIHPDEKDTISVDTIRELKTKFATKAGDQLAISRIAIIKRAETMTIEAQNALLKLLEEPTANTLLVVETSSAKKLLETITSRTQVIPVLPIVLEQAEAYCRKHKIPNDECSRAYLMSGGNSQMFLDIVHGRDSASVKAIQTAKTFLKNSVFERLKSQKDYADSENMQMLLSGMQAVGEAALHSTHAHNWEKVLQEVHKAKELLANNVNTKLVYLRLSVML